MNPRNIQHGAVAGIAGGIVFGAMMGMMGQAGQSLSKLKGV